MEGLRTPENAKFLVFFRLVQKAAGHLGKIFFLDCGEGHPFEDETIECEDLSGWLVPQEEADEFGKIFYAEKEIPAKWDSCGTFVSWEIINGQIAIFFDGTAV